ncbi:two-component system, OmpR family, sensor histidine kinase ChvG [Burkholderiales bacterium]|nr:two-component system, OmpR family, sensor histidine kinase ChvG [Burkholderiales bacterium]
MARLGIRAQLLLVLTVFLALPWLGVEYAREIERVLRDAQERTLAGTAQAVAIALHDRPRLFDAPVRLVAPRGGAPQDLVDAAAARPMLSAGAAAAAPELEQILQGLTRTTARIRVVDRDLGVLAHAGSLRRERAGARDAPTSALEPLFALIMARPTEDFVDDDGSGSVPARPEVLAALDGIPAADRRRTPDARAVVVAAAHPIWVGDRVRGVVLVEETTNAVLAERNRAFERLFVLVAAILLVGSAALTLYATWLSLRIRRLARDAEGAIDRDGRVRGPLPGSGARDEIGDLARSYSGVLARLAGYASYQERLASRLSHELRTPLAVVRSSLDNLRASPLPQDARPYIERAQGGLDRLAAILARMTEAARLEEALGDAERVRFDLAEVVAGCIEGYRGAYPQRAFAYAAPPEPLHVRGAPEIVAQMLDKLAENAVDFATGGAVEIALSREGDRARLSVSDEGPPLPEGSVDRLFEPMVSVRPQDGRAPHLGLGLAIVRIVAMRHGGEAHVANRADGRGVVVTVWLPLASGDAD